MKILNIIRNITVILTIILYTFCGTDILLPFWNRTNNIQSYNFIKDKYYNGTNYSSIIINELQNIAYFSVNNTSTYKMVIPHNSKMVNNMMSIFNNTDIIYETRGNNYGLFNIYLYIASFIVNAIVIGSVLEIIINIVCYFFESQTDKKTLVNQILGKSANIYQVIYKTNVTFNDVIGQEVAKNDLKECINYFLHKNHYTSAGFKPPKGLLFSGSPGTGKTLMAKAFAEEIKANFLAVSGSEFNGVIYGLGVERVKSLFEYARKNKPCVIFIDEIDSIGRKKR